MPCRAFGTGRRLARPTSRGIRSSIDRTAWAVVISVWSLALISPAYYLCSQSLFESKGRIYYATRDGTRARGTARRPRRGPPGGEPALITALTDAVVQVYGEWARDLVVVHLDGVPRGRWGIGGKAADDAAPAITFGLREGALTRPGGEETAARLRARAPHAGARAP